MKTSSLKTFAASVFVVAAISLSSCKKEPSDGTPTTGATDSVSATPADTSQSDTTATKKPIIRTNSEDGTNSAL